MVNGFRFSNSASKKKKRNLKTTRKEIINMEKGMVIAFFYCLQNIALVAQAIRRP